MTDKIPFENAECAMKHGYEKAKTDVAFYKLSGTGGAEYDEKGAVALLEERTEKKDHEAEWMLGLCYEYGMGVEQDINKAELLYKQCSRGKNLVGRFLLERDEGQRGSASMKLESMSLLCLLFCDSS